MDGILGANDGDGLPTDVILGMDVILGIDGMDGIDGALGMDGMDGIDGLLGKPENVIFDGLGIDEMLIPIDGNDTEELLRDLVDGVLIVFGNDRTDPMLAINDFDRPENVGDNEIPALLPRSDDAISIFPGALSTFGNPLSGSNFIPSRMLFSYANRISSPVMVRLN